MNLICTTDKLDLPVNFQFFQILVCWWGMLIEGECNKSVI